MRIEQLWLWGSLGLFGFLSGVIWWAWISMTVHGAPPNWPWLLRFLPFEFVPRLDAIRLTAATLIMNAMIGIMQACWHKKGKGLIMGVAGMTLMWALLTTLWMPWLDFAKSYRPVFTAMPIPDSTDCIASVSLGEGERAMLRYVTGMNTTRMEVSPTPIVQPCWCSGKSPWAGPRLTGDAGPRYGAARAPA